jgi:hypothetical protein
MPRKLSFREQRELEQLPGEIERLEAEQRDLEARVAGPAFYREPREVIAATLARIEDLHALLAAAYVRWDELDARSGRHASVPRARHDLGFIRDIGCGPAPWRRFAVAASAGLVVRLHDYTHSHRPRPDTPSSPPRSRSTVHARRTIRDHGGHAAAREPR